MLLKKGENSEILLFLFRMFVQAYVGFSFGSGWVNVISVRLSVPEPQLCEQWSGEAWTQPPMAISVERRQPNKQRKA